MNPIDDQLARLFRAAKPGGDRDVSAPPFGLETRVLAAWRGARPVAFWDTGLLVKGLILGVVIMGLSLVPILDSSSSATPYSDYLQLADSTIQFDSTP